MFKRPKTWFDPLQWGGDLEQHRNSQGLGAVDEAIGRYGAEAADPVLGRTLWRRWRGME